LVEWLRHLLIICRSQWPCGLKCKSAGARLLRLWVRIPPGAWIFVCCECCVSSARGLCDELIARPEESYRLWCVVVCDLETSWMRRPWPTEGCHAKNKQINLDNLNLSVRWVAVPPPPPPPCAACCNAILHKCPLNDFWDCTGTCDVSYLARTVNYSYPTSACLWVLYKDIKRNASSLKLCRLCDHNREGGGAQKPFLFRPALCILMLWTVTTGDADLWNIFVNEPLEIFLGNISLPQLCYNASNNVTWPHWLSL